MSLLKFSGKGYEAAIVPGIQGDLVIELSVFEGAGDKHLSLVRGDSEQITMTSEETIALRNYLNQICVTL